MNRRTPAAARCALALAATALTACASTSKSEGLLQVDDLVGHVETVHLQAGLAKQSVYDTLGALHAVVAPDFEGEAAEVFEAFVLAIEQTEARTEELEGAYEPMQDAAGRVFDRWEADLEAFASEGLRERSRQRLEATRARYETVSGAAADALEALAGLNAMLRDQALFLEHDFNAQAAAELRPDALALRDDAKRIGLALDATMESAARYVRQSALRSQVRVRPDAEVSEPEPEAAPDAPTGADD